MKEYYRIVTAPVILQCHLQCIIAYPYIVCEYDSTFFQTVIFAVSALVVYLEYRRQARNTARHEKSQSDTLAALVQQVELLHLRLARLELAQGLPPGPAPPPLPLPSDESSESASTSSAHASSSSSHTTNGSGSGDVKTQGTNSGKVASATKSAATPTAQNDAPSSAASSVKPSATATVNKK